MSVRERVQDAAEDGRAVVGRNETLKEIEDLDEVVVASNVPGELVEEVREAVEDAGSDLVRLEGSRSDLGSLCGKPFTVSTVGIKK